MKKIFLALTAVMLSLCCLAGCVGNTPDKPDTPDVPGGHTHTFDLQRWEYDENTHWRASTCEHVTERGNEAGHTMKDQKCEVCGYSVVGMPVEEFKQNYAENAKEFARLCAGIGAQSAIAAKISSEFVWFATDENNKLTDVTYLYTVKNEDGTSKVNRATLSGLNPIDLKEVAAGNANLQYQDGVLLVSHDNEFTYNTDQAGYQTLAGSLYTVFVERFDASAYDAPLFRFANVDKIENGFRIDVFDLPDTGYAHYYVRVSADENASLDELVEVVNSPDGIVYHAASVKTAKGTLVYQTVQDKTA